MPKPFKARLTDEDLMPFGKHKGERLCDIPASYFLWLSGQDWLDKFPALKAYVDSEDWESLTEFDDDEGYL